MKDADFLIRRLELIGFPPEECERIRQHYGDDIDGLTRYVLYCVALFDDRREYVD